MNTAEEYARLAENAAKEARKQIAPHIAQVPMIEALVYATLAQAAAVLEAAPPAAGV